MHLRILAKLTEREEKGREPGQVVTTRFKLFNARVMHEKLMCVSLPNPIGNPLNRPDAAVLGELQMACKQCGAKNQQMFTAELSCSFPGIENLGKSPVYLCQSIFICLDCGDTELTIPAAELGQLKQGLSGRKGQSHSPPGSSLSSR